MADRLRVIDGGGVDAGGTPASAPYRGKSGQVEQLKLHACPRCSAELGHDFGMLVQMRQHAVEVITKAGISLTGGSLVWACAKCFRPYYHIKRFPSF